MADVLIRGMEMPTHCDDCTFYDGIFCARTGYYIYYPEEKLEECPLIEVPDHGDLIDRDALDADLEKQDMKTGEWDAIGFSIYEIENAPIVIPADHFRDATKMMDKEET